MTEILEAIMLVCFGLSWPISLIRNIQQKTAAGMNIYFILLIILGYLAGITAKLISHYKKYIRSAHIITSSGTFESAYNRFILIAYTA